MWIGDGFGWNYIVWLNSEVEFLIFGMVYYVDLEWFECVILECFYLGIRIGLN